MGGLWYNRELQFRENNRMRHDWVSEMIANGEAAMSECHGGHVTDVALAKKGASKAEFWGV
jgi:hypothetical protein